MAKHIDPFLRDSLAYLGMPLAPSQTAWTPNTDVYEKDDVMVVKMEIAGIEKDDLEITLNDRMLIVRGYRRDQCRQSPQRCAFRQMEIDYGYFERRVVIPRSVDGGRARARFHNGFLHIELPKAQSAVHTTVTVVIEQAE